MRRRSMMEHRKLRVMSARSEAFGATISREFRNALDSRSPLAILLAVGVEIRGGAKIPRAVVGWYDAVNADPTTERVESFAQDVVDVFVNAETEAARAVG